MLDALLQDPNVAALYQIGVALAIGILIGAERGWQKRDLQNGERVAGIRTFTIIGLLGGATGWLSRGELVFVGIVFLAITALVFIAHRLSYKQTKGVGITSAIASLTTYILGAAAGLGYTNVAVACGVTMALVLGIKPLLHNWMERIKYEELLAALQLLAMSAILLPVLPNENFGPWNALNPFQLWLMIILIAAISFTGYISVRLAGKRLGLLVSGFCGGWASSTAVTLNFSRLGRQDPSAIPSLASGIIVASSTMFPRLLLITAAFNWALVAKLIWPFALATIGGLLATMLFWKQSKDKKTDEKEILGKPFEFMTTMKFGLILALVMILVRSLNAWLGDAGIYAASLVSGGTDVGAITLGLARDAATGITLDVAAAGIVIAAFSNTVVKAAMTVVVGGRGFITPGLVMAGLIALGLGSGLAVSILELAPPLALLTNLPDVKGS